MAYPFKIHEEAFEEYMEAYGWYEEKKIGLGERFMHNVEKKLQQISEHPEYFGTKQNSHFREAKIESFPYMIVYEYLALKKIIHIAAIYHARRNPKTKFRRQLK